MKYTIYEMIDYYSKLLGKSSTLEEYHIHFGYTIPTEESVIELVRESGKDKILEVGSGLGLWGSLLQSNGIDLVCTDDYSWNAMNMYPFTKIEKLDYMDALAKYRDRKTLLVIYPPPEGPMVDNILNEFVGDKVIFIGENPNNDYMQSESGSQKFHKLLKNNYKLKKEINIPNFHKFNSKIYVYQSKNLPMPI